MPDTTPVPLSPTETAYALRALTGVLIPEYVSTAVLDKMLGIGAVVLAHGPGGTAFQRLGRTGLFHGPDGSRLGRTLQQVRDASGHRPLIVLALGQ